MRLKDKIKELNALRRLIPGLKKKGKRIVFTNGCFDIMHLGHAQYLQEARKLGDVLIVAVNSDASVKRIKGAARPILGQDERAGLVAALESVSYVVIFNEDNPLKTMQALAPDVLVKGADWKKTDIIGADFVRGLGGKVATIKLVKGHSTSNIISKIKAT